MKLRYPIALYKKAAIKDDYGGEDISYNLLDNVWADIIDSADSEEEASESMTAKRSYFFIMRYRDDLNESDLIRYEDERGTNDYNIISINEDFSKNYKMYIKVEAEMFSNVVKIT